MTIGEEQLTYKSVSIPDALANEIDGIAEILGYRSRAEFVNDAIRRFLEQKKAELKDCEKEGG